MRRFHFEILTLLTIGCIAGSSIANERPNILFILADDLAFSDLGCYGHPWHHTPHLDALARAGVRFTQGYAPAPICSASRAAILTGKTTARLHFEFVTKNEPGSQKIDGPTKLTAPPFTLNLSLGEQTIAEALGELGYQTAFFGKWHLNSHHKRYLGWSPTHGPTAQGFTIAEEDFGSHPYGWTKTSPVTIDEPGHFPPDSMIERTVQFLKGRHDRPFFLMASQFYVHTPVRTRCEWLLEKYEGLVPADSPNRSKRVTYAAFVEELDHRVGVILAALDDAGLCDNTLVLFTSDNGGHPEYTANSPLRGSKWNLYEGGIRVPWIVRWPGQVEADSVSEAPVIGYDLLPTFVDLAGGKTANIDGTSLVRLLRGKSPLDERTLLWHFPYYHPERGYAAAVETIGVDDFVVSKTRPQSALRQGPYKLVYFYEDERAELYDLNQDIGEQQDLSERDPELTARLKETLLRRLRAADARFPTSNTNEP